MLEEFRKITDELVNNSTYSTVSWLIYLCLGWKSICDPSMNECMKCIVGGRGSLGPINGGTRRQELQCKSNVSVMASRLHTPCWPLSCPMIPYPWPANLTELLVPVAMATCAYREMSQLLWDKIFPFPQATQCLSVFFLYILLPSTSALACRSHWCI